jgi:hypothetical protein
VAHSHVVDHALAQRTANFAAKEAARDASPTPNRFWAPPYTIENIIDSLQAMLEWTPSAATLALNGVRQSSEPLPWNSRL